jgi:hypothetical protein
MSRLVRADRTAGIDAQTQYIQANRDAFIAEYPSDYMGEDSDGEESPLYLFNHCLYQALGAAAMHQDAYLFAPKGSEPWKWDSVWASIEYPALTQNPNIQTIYQVDPQPVSYKREHPDKDPKFRPPPVQPPSEGEPAPACGEEKLDEPTILWSRARGDLPVLFSWHCPVGDELVYDPPDTPSEGEPDPDEDEPPHKQW